MSAPAIIHDTEFAEELGCNVRYLRKILDETPRSHLLIGRKRMLLPRHKKVIREAIKNGPPEIDPLELPEWERFVSYVYFVKGGKTKNIKIGYSGNMPNRMRDLQASSPDVLHPIYYFKGTKRHEAFLHELFSAFRIHGEWFKPSVRIKGFIRLAEREGIDHALHCSGWED